MNFFRSLKFSIPAGIIFWLILFFVIDSFPSCAHAGDFTTETIVEESVYQALHAVDISQTVYIAKHPDQFYEKEIDWAIGRHPSEAHVLQFMVGDAVLHAAVTTALVRLDAPAWATRTWELVTIAASANNVRGNFNVGIRASF
jgi:hypothetical protein